MSRSLGTSPGLGIIASLGVSTTTLAVFPGKRGKIVFVSGIGGPSGDDSGADVIILDGPGGSVAPVDTRSPTW